MSYTGHSRSLNYRRNQGQQGIPPVQHAAPIAQQVAAANTTPGVAIAVRPAMIFNNFAFINNLIEKMDVFLVITFFNRWAPYRMEV